MTLQRTQLIIPSIVSTQDQVVQYSIQAILFDLDGVLTDTAEYHFLAWKRLADELRIRFTREDNDRLRGVSRRGSLDIILDLGGQASSEPEAQEMMTRKNGYYRKMLARITPADLLPGVARLLEELRSRDIKIAVASASRNSPDVIESLGSSDRIDELVHGGHVARQKPHPDLFLYGAKQLGLPASACVGIGPKGRVGAADRVFPDLEHVSAKDLVTVVRNDFEDVG